MDDRMHTRSLGTLVNNIQALEFSLRSCLFKDEITKGISKQLNTLELVKGEIVPNNALTNWDTLRDLIQKYNELPISKDLTIDENLVDIRDTIAHGRVFSSAPNGINQLLRFQKPNNNGVEVEFSVAMTEEWFTTQFLRFYDAVRIVDAVYKRQDAGN